MKVLIVDQFSGLHPRYLQLNPTQFRDLEDAVQKDPKAFGGFRPARVEDVSESYVPVMATTILREGADGFAEIWKARWDTSG